MYRKKQAAMTSGKPFNIADAILEKKQSHPPLSSDLTPVQKIISQAVTSDKYYAEIGNILIKEGIAKDKAAAAFLINTAFKERPEIEKQYNITSTSQKKNSVIADALRYGFNNKDIISIILITRKFEITYAQAKNAANNYKNKYKNTESEKDPEQYAQGRKKYEELIKNNQDKIEKFKQTYQNSLNNKRNGSTLGENSPDSQPATLTSEKPSHRKRLRH